MGALVGLVVGYLLGVRAGPKGLDDLRDAWDTIRTSDEVRDLVAGGVSMLGELSGRARELLVERLQPAEDQSGLRRAA